MRCLFSAGCKREVRLLPYPADTTPLRSFNSKSDSVKSLKFYNVKKSDNYFTDTTFDIQKITNNILIKYQYYRDFRNGKNRDGCYMHIQKYISLLLYIKATERYLSFR